MSYKDVDLFRQMEMEMQRMADEALRGFFTDIPAPNKFWQPRTDMYETADTLVVKMEVAGLRADQINISISRDNRVLTVACERVEETDERSERIRCYQLEIYFGNFEREVILPAEVRIERENIKADYKDGILQITLAKRQESTGEGTRIPVNG